MCQPKSQRTYGKSRKKKTSGKNNNQEKNQTMPSAEDYYAQDSQDKSLTVKIYS